MKGSRMGTYFLLVWVAAVFYYLGKSRGKNKELQRLPDRLRHFKGAIDVTLRNAIGAPEYNLHLHVGDEVLVCPSLEDASQLSLELGRIVDRFVPVTTAHSHSE